MKSAQLLLVLVLSSLASFAGTLRVPQDYPTVQAAVAASVAGDTILVSPGLYVIPGVPSTILPGTDGLELHDGTTLAGSGPAQTVLEFTGADAGIVPLGTATVKLLHLRKAAIAINAYIGSNITVTNVLITDPTGTNVYGMELNQGNSYTIHNNTIDNIHQTNDPFGTAIDVPFVGGVTDIQNNLLTSNTHGVTAGSFSGGIYTYNDVFGSTIADWSTCTANGCTPVSAPANNISADPLYCTDFTLQPGSPAVHAGNPAILNPDGTRSDIGAYGGPEAIFPATPCGGPMPPSRLRATVGNQFVFLYWKPPTQVVDSYHIHRDDGSTVTIIDVSGTDSSKFDFGLQNAHLYRYTVTAISNGVESPPSNEVFARPGEFAVSQPPPRPTNPILFLHGLQFDFPCPLGQGAQTWDITKAFLSSTVGWTFGGELYNEGDPIGAHFRNNFFVQSGDYFTESFGNGCANYSDRLGITHQGFEVTDFVSTLRQRSIKAPLTIVAHSMGGLAARSFLERDPVLSRQITYQLVTYGTPHRGASWTFLDPFGILSDGVRDMAFICESAHLTLNPFLDTLDTQPLPNIHYTSIVGHSHDNFVTIHGVNIPLPDHRPPACLSSHWDGVVPIDSADLRFLPAPPPNLTVITTDITHVQEPEDITAILCALDPTCFIIRTGSPVDIEITAPDGRFMSTQHSEIPAASYYQVQDETGDAKATVLLPFPLGGDYSIKVVPKPGALPTDTYSLEVTRVGVTTVLAQDQKIQDIPPQPYVVTVMAPIAIDIRPGDFPNNINRKSKGKIPVAILSTRVFSAPTRVDTSSLTFGRTGDEASLVFCSGAEDVNRDGLLDLVCHFDTQRLGFEANDNHGVLKGRSVQGIPFMGTDSIVIVK